jgi:hypothetical protein
LQYVQIFDIGDNGFYGHDFFLLCVGRRVYKSTSL